MKIKNYILFILLIVLASFSKQSSSAWTVCDKKEILNVFKSNSDWHTNNSCYEMSIRNESYENHTTKTRSDISEGYLRKQGDLYHSYIMGIHTVQNSKYRLTIDSATSTILISEAKKEDSFTGDFKLTEEILNKSKKLEKKLSEKENFYRVTFNPNRLYDVYEVKTTKENKPLMKQVTLYFSEEIKHDPNDINSKKSKPRVEIHFSSHKILKTFDYSKEFDEAKYVSKKGVKFFASDKYKNYSVKDLRVNTNS